jgi:hypothetical protein
MTAESHAMVTTTGHELVEHSPVGGLSHDARGGISNPILGMILFICSEVMFFSGLFAAYFSVRASSPTWPPIIKGGADLASQEAAAHLNEAFNLHAEPGFAFVLTVDPGHQLVHVPDGDLGDPPRRSPRDGPGDRRHPRARDPVPDRPGLRLLARSASASRTPRSGRPSTR